MSAKKIWVPFSDTQKEENPFHFNLARKSMENAIQMCWLSLPVDKGRDLKTLATRSTALLEELLRDAREDAARHGVT